MSTRSIVGLLILGALGFAGCSAEPPAPAPSPSASAFATATPTPTSAAPATAAPAPTAAAPATALSIAERLQASIPTITSVTEVTETNDPTGSIGQPSGYTSAAWIADTGAAAKENSVVGGAVVEVFASDTDAQARLSFLQQHIAQGPAYNAEHHYLKGTALLRLSGSLTPDQASLYEHAFKAG